MPKLVLGDCVERMKNEDASIVDLTVTSAPYGNLRHYGGEVFSRDKFEEAAPELWRLTKPGGVVCWQMGDWVEQGGYSLDPFRQAIYFQDIGFRVHDVIITGTYGVRYPIPRRYKRPPVYVFVLAKGRPKSVSLIRDRENRHPGKIIRYNERVRDGSLRYKRSTYTIPQFGVRTTVWLYPPGQAVASESDVRAQFPALMHEALARDLIQSYSSPGDLVCDPFAGACTTGKMAVLLGRDFLGWEIHPPYYEMGVTRLRLASDFVRRRALRSRREAKRLLSQ